MTTEIDFRHDPDSPHPTPQLVFPILATVPKGKWINLLSLEFADDDDEGFDDDDVGDGDGYEDDDVDDENDDDDFIGNGP